MLVNPEADEMNHATMLGVAAISTLILTLGGGVGSSATASGEAPQRVATNSECLDFVVIGAQGSGQTLADFDGLGAEVWLGLETYADNLAGYDVGYYPIPYPSVATDVLFTKKTRKIFFESIDSGVKETILFLSAREAACRGTGERYVLAGYSQGAMVMHRVIFNLLTSQSQEFSSLAARILPKLDGVLAIADGDRIGGQGGSIYGGAFDNSFGVGWLGAGSGVTPSQYRSGAIPTSNASWPVERFHSVCDPDDAVCRWDWSKNAFSLTNSLLSLHPTIYKSDGRASVSVRSAATDIARTSRQQSPLPSIPARVGQPVSVNLINDSKDVASLAWVSDPIPNSALFVGGETNPAYLVWTPESAGTVSYVVRSENFDGSSRVFSGSITAFAVPERSLYVSGLESPIVVEGADDDLHARVRISISGSESSGTSPTRLTTLEDPASDFFYRTSGDTDSDDILDSGESWIYEGRVTWPFGQPPGQVERTLLVYANDLTGASEWLELSVRFTLDRY